jgi:phosphoribosylanthranilate isomerase
MKVKICCISSVDEALLAIQSGATELGVVGPMPSGPGVISEQSMIEIVASVPKGINTFLLTSEVSAQKIITQHSNVKTSTIQIVDKLTSGTYHEIREAIPDIKLVQVIHVTDENSIEEALKVANEVDFLLLDSGSPNKSVKELGGTGRTHNWEISKQIVNSTNTPVFLAGGINALNVKLAIESVNPYGVDLCSSVRSNGKLNRAKLSSFFTQISSK